jgi:hypothetical protein
MMHQDNLLPTIVPAFSLRGLCMSGVAQSTTLPPVFLFARSRRRKGYDPLWGVSRVDYSRDIGGEKKEQERMLRWYEWFVYVLMLIVVVLALIIIYRAIIGETTLFPNIQPIAPTGSSPPTTGPTGSSTTGLFCGGVTGLICNALLGQVCVNGMCVCAQSGFTSCSGIGCVDTTSSPFACGGCGIKCLSSEICCGGVCVSSSSITNCFSCGVTCIGAMPACCQGICVDLDNSSTNCGSCLVACPTGSGCCGGVCTDTTTSTNCGGCGISCGPNQVCTNGTCVSGCETGSTLCPPHTGVCTAILTDNFNCGGCGTNCAPGTFCVNGMCSGSDVCENGWIFCPVSGGCVAGKENNNCGTCGTVCPNYCNQGACACTTSYDCPLGQICGQGGTGLCGPNACTDLSRPTFCGNLGQCVNTNTNPLACGFCGTSCVSGVCSGGLCTCTTDEQCSLGRDCVSGLCQFH